MIKWIKKILEQSSIIHIRRREIGSVDELKELIERFLNDDLHYPLEWDDFISWRNSNKKVEKIRNNIGQWEVLLFSSSSSDKERYSDNLKSLLDRI